MPQVQRSEGAGISHAGVEPGTQRAPLCGSECLGSPREDSGWRQGGQGKAESIFRVKALCSAEMVLREFPWMQACPTSRDGEPCGLSLPLPTCAGRCLLPGGHARVEGEGGAHSRPEPSGSPHQACGPAPRAVTLPAPHSHPRPITLLAPWQRWQGLGIFRWPALLGTRSH